MATVLRTSGASKQIIDELGKKNVKIESITELSTLLKEKKALLVVEQGQSEKDKLDLEQQFSIALNNRKIKYDHTVKRYEAFVTQRKRMYSEQIAALDMQERKLHKGKLLQRLFQAFKIVQIKLQSQKIHNKQQNFFRQSKNKFKALEKAHTEKNKRLNEKKDAFHAGIEKKIADLKEQILAIETTLKSGTYFGAVAELKMIDCLARLPDQYYVINDVNLRLDTSMRFDDEWLKSAQIDHLVVGPAGIFVIEVKNWSHKFSKDGDYFNPYQQIKRHNYVCYILISRFIDITVRSIIAYTGHIPQKPDNSYTKVLPIEKVNGYITWFKETKLSSDDVRKIVEYIKDEIENTSLFE